MTQVNSPFLLSKIRPLNENTELQNNYFFQLERMLQQLYQRTGGSVDAVEENEGLITTTAHVMSIANQGLHEVEELNAYNYARHQAELDRLKDDLEEISSSSAAKCMDDDVLSRIEEIEARQTCIMGMLDGLNEKLNELEGLSHGYNA